jgi:ribosomal protein S18 acetylase RimI-like enzyme
MSLAARELHYRATAHSAVHDHPGLVLRMRTPMNGHASSASARVSSVMSGYSLVMTPPPLKDYLRLRADTGLSPKTEQQGAAGLFGAWAACHVVHEETRTVVGMGRLLGDGGWYFHVIDMAVLPEHQRRGLGDAILTALLNRIRAVAPPGAYVNLLADPPGRSLYERHGFTETAPHSVGMVLRL